MRKYWVLPCLPQGKKKTTSVLKTEIISKVRKVSYLIFPDWISRADVGRMVWNFDRTNHRYDKHQLHIMVRALCIPVTGRTRGYLISQIQIKRRHVEIEDEDEIYEEEEGEGGDHPHRNFPSQLDAYTPTTITNEIHHTTSENLHDFPLNSDLVTSAINWALRGTNIQVHNDSNRFDTITGTANVSGYDSATGAHKGYRPDRPTNMKPLKLTCS